ncbi:hypothetical protein SAMD00024442_82_4 [Candidatus Symbiothrix dinenymphae]|nr:hypothetical protein SAMD00024442_82_4 [Candidatus Symbiothrix dinenymphae]
MKIIKCFLVCVTTLAFFSCTEKTLEPISGSKGKPGVITEVVPKPIPGGVEITYRIPNNEDILGVKTEYTLSNGQKRESVTSVYNNTLRIEGFTDTDEHTALVYAVNLAQELSEPVTIQFTPLESPLTKTIRSVEIVEDWGGVQFRWKNLDKAPLNFELLAVDSVTNTLKPARIIASNADSLAQVLRGYKPEPQKFALLVSDLFGNKSDTIYPGTGNITRLFEER